MRKLQFFKHFSVYVSIFTKLVLLLISNFRGVRCSECCILSFWSSSAPNFMCRRFGTHCTILIGGVSRKNNRDVTVGVFIQEEVWLNNSRL